MPLDERQSASREQFERQSRSYGKSHILADTSDLEEALDGVLASAGSRGLDVATGGGHAAVFLARRGWNVTASDLSPAMLERARELAAEDGLGVTTAEHPAEELPYPDASFQIVTCRVAAHHFSDQARFVNEAARVLEPDGYFLLIDGSVPDGEPEAEEWIHGIEKLRDPSHGRFRSPESWSGLVRAAGLEILKCTTVPFKQPDLEWYFETAATSPENRLEVLRRIDSAPDAAQKAFGITREGDKVVWWWPRVALLAHKPVTSC